MLLPEVPRLGAYTIQANVVGRGTGTCHHRLETSVPSMNVADALTQCPHNDRTPAEPRVRALCTRALRGCPAGLPGRARGAAQTVPDLTPHHGTGEPRSGTQQSASGQASRAEPRSRSRSRSKAGMVGLRPPTATLRAAHDSTASNNRRGNSPCHRQPRIVGLQPPAPRAARHPRARATACAPGRHRGAVNPCVRTS